MYKYFLDFDFKTPLILFHCCFIDIHLSGDWDISPLDWHILQYITLDWRNIVWIIHIWWENNKQTNMLLRETRSSKFRTVMLQNQTLGSRLRQAILTFIRNTKYENI